MYIYTNIHIYKCTYIHIYRFTHIYIFIHTHVVLSKSSIAMAHSFHGNVWKIARGYSWQKHPPVPPWILPGHPPLLRHAEPLLVGSTLAPWSDAQPQPDAATGLELLESWCGDRVGPRWPVLHDLTIQNDGWTNKDGDLQVIDLNCADNLVNCQVYGGTTMNVFFLGWWTYH